MGRGKPDWYSGARAGGGGVGGEGGEVGGGGERWTDGTGDGTLRGTAVFTGAGGSYKQRGAT